MTARTAGIDGRCGVSIAPPLFLRQGVNGKSLCNNQIFDAEGRRDTMRGAYGATAEETLEVIHSANSKGADRPERSKTMSDKDKTPQATNWKGRKTEAEIRDLYGQLPPADWEEFYASLLPGVGEAARAVRE
jgi:hypothetical protein